jgi:hypothetical protein
MMPGSEDRQAGVAGLLETDRRPLRRRSQIWQYATGK